MTGELEQRSGQHDARPLRVAHVCAGLSSATDGVAAVVLELNGALAASGVDVEVLSVAAAGEMGCETRGRGFADRRFPRDPAALPLLGRFTPSRALAAALDVAAARCDVLHSHGLWLLPNFQAARSARRAGRPHLISPHGMINPVALGFSRRRKQIVWRAVQGRAVRRAACLHATSFAEYEDLRRFGLENPVAIVANGIAIPEERRATMGPKPLQRTLLSLGRLHPKKGLLNLMEAWCRLEADFPHWRLRLAGPDEGGHEAELRNLIASAGLARLSIEGPLTGAAKADAYAAAELFVLPSLHENFALTVAEALAAGTPAVVSKGAPWPGLVSEGCGWWIDCGPETLARGLAEALAQPPERLAAMGARGRLWMARDFAWTKVAAEMQRVYAWLAGRNDRPECVILD